MIANICLNGISILAFLICAIFLVRSKQVHIFIGLSWGTGLVTAIAGIFVTLNWQNPNFGAEWRGIFAVFLVISGTGLLFWLVAFEFYTSALTMEDILFKKPLSLSKNKKFRIFTTVAGIYILLVMVLCIVQFYIN